MNNSALVPKSWLSVFIDKKKRENIDVWVEHCERRFIWSTCGQNWPFQSDMTPECRYTSKSGNSFSFQMQLSALWYRSTVKKKKKSKCQQHFLHLLLMLFGVAPIPETQQCLGLTELLVFMTSSEQLFQPKYTSFSYVHIMTTKWNMTIDHQVWFERHQEI